MWCKIPANSWCHLIHCMLCCFSHTVINILGIQTQSQCCQLDYIKYTTN
jgi:hypothetical protein